MLAGIHLPRSVRQFTARPQRFMGAIVLPIAIHVLGVFAEEEEKPPSTAELSVAAMLLGSVTFVMAMFYLVNHPDDDMKRYSWNTISSTISIFIAVLVFQGFDGLVKEFLWEQYDFNDYQKIASGFGQQLIWQGLLFKVLQSCASADAEGDEYKKELDDEDREKIELNMAFFATLFAHVNGFAMINTFSLIQQQVGSSPALAFSIAPVALLYTSVVFRVVDKYRDMLEHNAEHVNEERNDLWNEGAEDAEDDIASLAVSFILAQSIRFIVVGRLPDVNGQDTQLASLEELGYLCVCSFLCALMILVLNKSIGEGKSVLNIVDLNEDQKKLAHFVSHILGMTFAWLALFNGSGFVRHLYLGDEVLTKLVAALLISFCAFLIIYTLDIIEQKAEAEASADMKNGELDAGLMVEDNMKAIGQLILSIGILIGFSWEKAFDEAIDAISEVSDVGGSKAIGNLLLTTALVGIVAPAWRFYIIPTVKKLDEEYAEKLNEEFGINLVERDIEGLEGGGIQALEGMMGLKGVESVENMVEREVGVVENEIEDFLGIGKQKDEGAASGTGSQKRRRISRRFGGSQTIAGSKKSEENKMLNSQVGDVAAYTPPSQARAGAPTTRATTAGPVPQSKFGANRPKSPGNNRNSMPATSTNSNRAFGQGVGIAASELKKPLLQNQVGSARKMGASGSTNYV